MESQIEFIPFRAENLPFEDKKFDLITAYGSFHHFPMKKKAMEEFTRVLSDKGYLVICLKVRL